MGGKTGFSISGWAIGAPSWTRARTLGERVLDDPVARRSAPVISSALMMSTPEAISVESVRDKRAIVTLRTTSPICIGMRSLNASHFARPVSVFFQRMKHEARRRCGGKTMYQRSAQAGSSA